MATPATNAYDVQVSSRAHTIDPTSPTHTFEEVALIVTYSTNDQERVLRCKGCPAERREPVRPTEKAYFL